MTLQALSTIGRIALVPCEHCGSRRMVTTVAALRLRLALDPTPLLCQAVQELGSIFGSHAQLYICGACSCITADNRDHSH